MTDSQVPLREKSRALLEAVVAYTGFCGIGLISRFVPVVFLLFLAFGITFPILWAKFSKDWGAIGFTKRNLGKALLWGLGTGVVWGGYTCAAFREDQPLPPLWGLQLLVAFPVWLLVMSPFQEFFFRGWLQPRLQVAVGRWWGLVVTSLAFVVWHFFPQLEGTMTTTLPLSSLIGIISIFTAGLLFGYIYQRTDNIVAPWLAHAVGGIVLVLIGRMSFLQYTP